MTTESILKEMERMGGNIEKKKYPKSNEVIEINGGGEPHVNPARGASLTSKFKEKYFTAKKT